MSNKGKTLIQSNPGFGGLKKQSGFRRFFTKRNETVLALIFIAPWLIGFLVFTVLPILSSFYYSLSEYNVINPPKFIGFKNYENLFKDKNYIKALYNTGFMVIFGVSVTSVFTLTVSILLNNRNLKHTSLFKVLFYIPTLVPLVITCLLWVWVLQFDTGIINTVLRAIGISNPPAWLSSPMWSKPALILMLVWSSGQAIIIYLAGLQDIPETLYESADIDGAGFVKKSLSITIPLLSPIILYNVVTQVIIVFQQFAEALIMTEGGPDRSTLFYALYLYQNAFQFFKMGYASAMSWIMLLVALAIIFVLFKLLNKVND